MTDIEGLGNLILTGDLSSREFAYGEVHQRLIEPGTAAVPTLPVSCRKWPVYTSHFVY